MAAADALPSRAPMTMPRTCAVAASCLALAWAAGKAPEGCASDAPRSHLESAGAAAGEMVSAAGLGLKLTRASTVLRQQLALKRGAGLVVESVTPNSPAARAGFAQHDVLVRLDDQLLVLPEQLDALLESCETGSPVACTILRGGREIVVAIGQPHAARPRPVAGIGPGLRPTDSALALVGRAPPREGPIAAMPLRRLADETLVRHDADFQIRLTSGTETRLVVSDPQGHVVFSGSIDTPEDRSRMPPVIRERVLEMEQVLEDRDASDVAERDGTPAAEVGRLDVPPVELR